MNISWDLYKYFYFVCEFKNITKVANYFCVTQPAITKKIKALENQLGRTLVISTNKGITITEDGKNIYEMLKPSFEAFDNIESEFANSYSKNKPTINLTAGYITLDKIISPEISKFNKGYPDVDFNMMTCTYEDSLRKLKSGEIDIMFFSGDKLKEKDDSLVVKECYDIQDGFIISNKIKNDYPNKISIYDINKYPLIIKSKNSGSRKLMDNMLKKKGIEIKPKYEVSTYWILKRYIDANRGIGFYALDYIRDELKDGKYIEIPTIEEIPKRKIKCCYLRNSINKPIINRFISQIKEDYSKK